MENIETDIEKAGGFGFYQIILLIFSVMPLMLVAANMGASIFIAMIPKVGCNNPSAEKYLQENCFENYTLSKMDIPQPSQRNEIDYCLRYEFTTSANSSEIPLQDELSSGCNLTVRSQFADVIPCTDWIYDTTTMRNTVSTEFNLVCDHVWAAYFGQSALMLGVAVGSIVAGLISDKIGRRAAFLFSCVGTTIFGIIASLPTSFISYCVTRFFLGLFVFGAFPVLFVLVSELTVRSYRSLVAQLLELSFPLGFILLSLVSFALREWRHIQLAISVPFVIGVPIWWFLPESPRWLYFKGKEEEAFKIISKISTWNRTRMDDPALGIISFINILQSSKQLVVTELTAGATVEAPPKYEEVENPLVQDMYGESDTNGILKFPFLRGACIKLFYNWFAISCVYYGLTLNAADLGEDPFAILCLNSIAEMLAVILTVPLVNIVGRRITSFLSQSFAGLLCIAVVFMPKVIVPVVILGKFAISIAFSAMYIHANEIYPTPVRTSGLGVCNAMARLGGVLSPIIALLKTEMFHLPYIVFGALSLIASALALTLPETRCTRLPQTIQEGEEFISADRGFRNSCKRHRRP